MKALRLLVLSFAVLTGCQFDEAPYAKASGPADKQATGLWVREAEGKTEKLAVLISGDGKYFVDYDLGEKGQHWFFTGFPVIEGRSDIVQLEFLGSSEGKQPEDEKFMIVKWKTGKNGLVWSALQFHNLDKTKPVAKALEESLARENEMFQQQGGAFERVETKEDSSNE